MRTCDRSVHRWVVAAAVACMFCTVGATAAERTSTYFSALESITAGELQHYVDYLADDALEGREAGSPGDREAARFLTEHLEQLRLRPAGIDGGFFQPFDPNYRNILALLPGSDPELKDQVIVVGAHYDHVGYGTKYNSAGPIGQIHNGADDNASGTSGLLELAQALAMLPEPPKRSVLLVFWDAEEKGMFGSKHWLAHPTIPLNRVAAMINVDMIGRLRNDRVIVVGSRSSYGWRRLLSSHNDGPALHLDFTWSMEDLSDHSPFFDSGIPVLLLTTGEHENYHRPSDDANLINNAGMRRVVQLLFGTLCDLADEPTTPGFRADARRETQAARERLAERLPETAIPAANRLGADWDEPRTSGSGVRVKGVEWNSPAARSGLRSGDRIVRFANHDILSADDLTGAVTAAENPVVAVVYRQGRREPQEMTFELTGKPLRLGITWRVDDAEPGTVIITHVVPGSPAAFAGLSRGDRIYQVAGQDFADDAEFARLATSLPEPLELLVERDGQLRIVVLHFQSKPTKRAA